MFQLVLFFYFLTIKYIRLNYEILGIHFFTLMLIITGCSTSNNNIDNLELTKYFKVKFNTTKYLSMCVCNDKMYALANDSNVYFVTDLKK